MTTNVNDTIVEPVQTTSRFNARRIAKATLITTAVLGVALVLRSKLNGSVDGELNVSVETDKS